MEDFSLPTIEYNNRVDRNLLEISARDYFDFCIYAQLLAELLKADYEKELYGREQEFLKYVNHFLVNPGCSSVDSLSSLKGILLKAKNFYKEEYVSLLTEKSMDMSYEELVISNIFMQDEYMKEFKRLINNTSYFVLIVDQREKLSVVSQKAINGYVARRINLDISMKVACDINEWMTYYDTTGILIESPHDYISVELDSNFNDYVEEKKSSIKNMKYNK